MSDKSTIQEVAEGLTILAKYPDSDVCAGHDVIYASDPEETDAEDAEVLVALGWFIDDNGSWGHFV